MTNHAIIDPKIGAKNFTKALQHEESDLLKKGSNFFSKETPVNDIYKIGASTPTLPLNLKFSECLINPKDKYFDE